MANIAKVNDFKQLINTQEMFGRAKAACGSKEAARQFMASMLDLYEGDNYLQGCDPMKVAIECYKAASLNLPLVKSLGYAYVVPYKSTPTFIIGYKGYIQLALRSGQYKCINADCVYEGEEITVDRLRGTFTIDGAKKSEKAIGYFAYFQLINGFERTHYMTVQQIQDYAKKYSKAYSSGPWQTEFDAMAKKTVLRQILKYGPMSTEMQHAESMELQAAQAAARQEIDDNANKTVIDIDPAEVDEETGEVMPAVNEEPDF